jgi:hypothetical protein
MEIGLGKAERISNLKVIWPTRKNNIQEFQNIEPDKAYDLKEGGKLVPIPYDYVPFKKEAMHHQHEEG